MTDLGKKARPLDTPSMAPYAALLNPSQRNVLRITLRLAEEALRAVTQLLDKAPFVEAMHGLADDLAADQKRAIADEVRRGREIIREVRSRFDLEPKIYEKSRLILGKVIHI